MKWVKEAETVNTQLEQVLKKGNIIAAADIKKFNSDKLDDYLIENDISFNVRAGDVVEAQIYIVDDVDDFDAVLKGFPVIEVKGDNLVFYSAYGFGKENKVIASEAKVVR